MPAGTVLISTSWVVVWFAGYSLILDKFIEYNVNFVIGSSVFIFIVFWLGFGYILTFVSFFTLFVSGVYFTNVLPDVNQKLPLESLP